MHFVDATMFWSATGGGVRRYLGEKHRWFAARPGLSHTIVAPGARGAGHVDCGGLPLPRSGGYRLPWRRGALARQLAALAPDLIEAGDPYRLAWATLDACRSRGIPAVAFCHSDLAAMAGQALGGAAEVLARAYLRRLYRRFDLVLAPGTAVTRRLHEAGIAHAETQPLGVDTTVFSPERRDPLWRAEIGVPADARVLVYAGRFAAEKHLDLLAAAVAGLGERYVLVAIGDGPRPPRGQRVIVRPFEARPEALARALASADAFVHAGDQETFGLAALEAMACGTPVVVRRHAGLAELVAGGAGIGVDDDGAAAFAAAIGALFAAGREVRDRHAAAGRAHALAHGWDAVFGALERRYEMLIATHRRGILAGTAGAPQAAARGSAG